MPFEGSSWIYMGNAEGGSGIRYERRRYEDGRVTFVLSAMLPGTYLLAFQRQDPLLDTQEIAYVGVEAIEGSIPGELGPSPKLSPAATASTLPRPLTSQMEREASPSPTSGSIQGLLSPSPASPFDAMADADLRKELGALLDAKKYAEAGRALSAYQGRVPEDEVGLWSAARLYEAPGPQRDMRKARDLYRRLLELFPESDKAPAAAARLEFIERRYLDIR